MTNGFIKLYRKMLENPIVWKDPDHVAVWVFILLNATHRETDVLFSGGRITLYPGQLLTSRKSICKKTKVDRSKVERVLKTFKNEHQIEQQTSSQNRLITILNWNTYHKSEQPFEQQVSSECATSEQRVSTNKNDKKEKNEENPSDTQDQPSGKRTSRKKKTLEVTEEWIASLFDKPAFATKDIRSEIDKARAWVDEHPGRLFSRPFVVNWLNRAASTVDPSKDSYGFPLPSPEAQREEREWVEDFYRRQAEKEKAQLESGE